MSFNTVACQINWIGNYFKYQSCSLSFWWHTHKHTGMCKVGFRRRRQFSLLPGFQAKWGQKRRICSKCHGRQQDTGSSARVTSTMFGCVFLSFASRFKWEKTKGKRHKESSGQERAPGWKEQNWHPPFPSLSHRLLLKASCRGFFIYLFIYYLLELYPFLQKPHTCAEKRMRN